MRVGDCGVEVMAANGGTVRELPSGHVLVRPGQVYVLRLRNYGPLRAVFDVRIDGRVVTGRGLVVEGSSTTDLERPIHATERGRFTVIAEGNEAVFGPDGGRDNPDLGLIEVRFRRELPSKEREPRELPPPFPFPGLIVPEPAPSADPSPAPANVPPRTPAVPPEWTPPQRPDITPRRSEHMDACMLPGGARLRSAPSARAVPQVDEALRVAATRLFPAAAQALAAEPLLDERETRAPERAIERAAGTGLTGHSAQEFVPTTVGKLEAEPTVVRLGLVIGSPEALGAARPLPSEVGAPGRPAPRP
jgi:hypothetical protein